MVEIVNAIIFEPGLLEDRSLVPDLAQMTYNISDSMLKQEDFEAETQFFPNSFQDGLKLYTTRSRYVDLFKTTQAIKYDLDLSLATKPLEDHDI